MKLLSSSIKLVSIIGIVIAVVALAGCASNLANYASIPSDGKCDGFSQGIIPEGQATTPRLLESWVSTCLVRGYPLPDHNGVGVIIP